MGEPTFNETQVREILRIASGEAVVAKDARGNTSLSELVAAAQELGVSESKVRSAVSVVVFGSLALEGPSQSGFISREALIEGELHEEDWPVVVGAIRRALGQAGESRVVGRSVEWLVRGHFNGQSFDQCMAVAASRDGWTRVAISVRQHFEGGAKGAGSLMLMMLPMLAFFIFMGLVLEETGFIVLGCTIFLVAFTASWLVIEEGNRKRSDTLDRAMADSRATVERLLAMKSMDG